MAESSHKFTFFDKVFVLLKNDSFFEMYPTYGFVPNYISTLLNNYISTLDGFVPNYLLGEKLNWRRPMGFQPYHI